MRSNIIDTGDYIIKRFPYKSDHINSEWFKIYQEFYTLFGNVPEIIECSPYSITMKKINGVTLHQWLWEQETQPTSHQILQITEQVLEAYHNFISFSVLKKKLFIHQDVHVENIIVRPDNTICFIDPDAITSNIKEYNSMGEFLIKLSSIYTRISTRMVQYE